MPKQMTKAERAEYMRVYRARKKQEEMRAGEIEAPRETPVSDTVDTSDAAILPVASRGQEKVRPAFLAAPDDDCAACGHDRQTYHLNAGGVCWAPAPNTRSRRCDCPAYVSAQEPF